MSTLKEIFEAKIGHTKSLTEEKASVEVTETFNLLKKLGVKYIKSAADLAYLIEMKAAVYNVAEAKSIWKSKQGIPEGQFLFVGIGEPMNIYDYTEKQLKAAGTSIEKFQALLAKAGMKQKKSLRKTFG